jgi:hypothetical protein
MKPMRNCCSAFCSGIDMVVVGVAVVGVDGGKLGDEGAIKPDRSRLARFRTFTKRGRSLED